MDIEKLLKWQTLHSILEMLVKECIVGLRTLVILTHRGKKFSPKSKRL